MIENALGKIDEYVSHRSKREKEIYDILQSKYLLDKFNNQNDQNSSNHGQTNNYVVLPLPLKNDEYLTSWEIMLKIYGNLPLFVKFSAQGNVVHHLEKLLIEKKVEYRWPDLWKIMDTSLGTAKDKDVREIKDTKKI